MPIETIEQPPVERSRESKKIEALWKKSGFVGDPPRPDTIAEERLIDACKSYTNIVLNDKLNKATGSEERRRELHNQIAIMTIGKQRSEVDGHTADLLANFASKVATGMSMQEAYEAFEK